MRQEYVARSPGPMYFRYSSFVWSSLSSQASVRLMLSVGVIAVPRYAMN